MRILCYHYCNLGVKAEQYFISSSCMLVDKKTLLKIWLNPALNLTIFRETGPRCFFKFFIFVSDGQRILSCGADHFMRVLDVHTGTEVYCKDVGEEIR